MQTKTTRKSFWQSITAIIGVTLIVGTGSAQTVTIDSAPSLNLRTAVDNSGLAFSSISIDPTTGNAQVNTTSNVTTCGSSGTRSVVVTSPNSATPGSTINVSWVANNFVGAATCSVSLGAGSALPTSGWTGTNLAYPATNSLSVVLGSAQPATYSFRVDCNDGQAANGTASTNVSSIVNPGDCTSTDLKKYRGVAINEVIVREWETSFASPGETSTPFPGEPENAFFDTLGVGGYASMRFNVPVALPVGFRTSINNTLNTGSSSAGLLELSVSECKGDFRSDILVNNSIQKICMAGGGIGGAKVTVVVDAGPGPYSASSCEIIRGRTYFVNTTFGTRSAPGNGAFCSTAGGCQYFMKRELAR